MMRPERGERSPYDGKSLAHGERHDEYGDPNQSFQRIANLWETYLHGRGLAGEGALLEPRDVAAMMILLKISRSITDDKADTIEDIIGYAECWKMLRTALL